MVHVAAEAGVSRRCLTKWYTRWLADGPAGLEDRASTPEHSPSRTPADVADLIEGIPIGGGDAAAFRRLLTGSSVPAATAARPCPAPPRDRPRRQGRARAARWTSWNIGLFSQVRDR
ncbi:leucine zipper domain-containing protein [Nonomuraea sp. NPDC049714]|uniref:leucine zipper domain-containing protein n=1 Tax=Nonomuraea sp. NPDC049714 TaxID=3364357 RepID=UPI00378FF6CD